ncbi:MAG: ion channel [Pseudomonadota bacterium]
MLAAVLTCVFLVTATTLLHHEVLSALNTVLPRIAIPSRSKLLVVIVVAFLAHLAEISLYGVSIYVLVTHLDAGALAGTADISIPSFIYFSAETYSSIGFGDLTPIGPVRLLAGVEALNGLLLIGWSASFTYISMERFWNARPGPEVKN